MLPCKTLRLKIPKKLNNCLSYLFLYGTFLKPFKGSQENRLSKIIFCSEVNTWKRNIDRAMISLLPVSQLDVIFPICHLSLKRIQ